MDERRQVTVVDGSRADSVPGRRAILSFIFTGLSGKIIFTVLLITGIFISFGPLAASQNRGHVDKALLAPSSSAELPEETGIQRALTKKSKQILAVWAAMKGMNSLINFLQSVQIGVSIGAEVSVNPAEILAPLDNTLDKISNMLLWALGAVLFEKLLLAISGYIVFKAVIPACLLVSVIAIWISNGRTVGKIFAVTILTCLVVRFAIPVSFQLSTAIESNLLSNEVERTVGRIKEKEKMAEQEQEKLQGEEKKKLWGTISGWTTKQTSKVKDYSNALIEDIINYIMVFFLTNVAIPILTLLGLYQFTKYLATVIMGAGRAQSR